MLSHHFVLPIANYSNIGGPSLCVALQLWPIWEYTLEYGRLEFESQIDYFPACFFAYKRGIIIPPLNSYYKD